MRSKNVLLINDTSNESHIGSRSVVNMMRVLCQNNNMIIRDTLNRLQIQTVEEPKIRDMIKQSDIILINGEGSLHHHPRLATEFFPYIMNLIPNNKKTVLLNTIWEDMNYHGIEGHIGKFNLISFRESLSYNNFHKEHTHKNTRVVPDIVFYNDTAKINKIGYSDSIKKGMRSAFKRKDNYMPLNFIDVGTYLYPKDLTYPSLQAYMLWLQSLDLFITGRFHGACLAILTGTPFLVYESNSHKIKGLLADAGLEECLIFQDSDEETCAETAKRVCMNGEPYSKLAKLKIEKLFEEISKL